MIKINLSKGLLISMLFCLTSVVLAQPGKSQQALKPNEQRYRLWYNKPAANWNEALPIGNGHIGGMVFGNVVQERIQLNEGTIWGGGPNNNLDSAAAPHLTEVRSLLTQKKYAEAQQVANKYLGPKGNSGMPYQLAGNLYIQFPGHEEVTRYSRDLDIAKAVATVSYTYKNVEYKREYFTSFTDNVLLVRLTANKPRMVSCQINLQSPLKQRLTATNNDLILAGSGSDHENQQSKIRFNIIARTKIVGGGSTTDSSGIRVQNADTALIYLSIATNFVNYKDVSAQPYQRALKFLDAAYKKRFNELCRAHLKYYQAYFNRVHLNLGTLNNSQPTDVRIQKFATSRDPQLAELYFQFGRYLLISSSQPSSQPANLQGIWNGELKGPWDSKYTVNINTEMNYWPSEVTQLTELNAPLFNMIGELAETGKSSAKVMYGARGWMLHHNTDIWRVTGVVDGAFWGLWPTANAWLCQHLWEHYLFTGDRKFLQQYYPVMKGAAQYFIDVLQKEPDHGWLVVSPSVSPEHEYIGGRNAVSVTAGATMDNQLVFGLFSNLINASTVLNTDQTFADTLKTLRDKLPPMQVGQYGQLQEWLNDLDSKTDNHRHVSHLYGLFPGSQISPFRQPQLFTAARNSLIYRGDVSTGWSMAWKINLWARLLDGNHAYKLIKDQISPVSKQSGGTYPNLFDAHPPFQIDGNFGCTSGIAEMLLQSHDGAIYLLPALPDEWEQGSISGLMARGGFKIGIQWRNHRIYKLSVYSTLGGQCRLRSNQMLNVKTLKTARGNNTNPYFKTDRISKPVLKIPAMQLAYNQPESWLYDLHTQPGKTYTFLIK
ncbi:glycoside hydrolase N-terminal domain-containing protein [Mucilaginibacter sp. PAMB04168]|uniref:glycoside hydrolase family 95 protein n=1 Tax=Mucilaginibacter sp. PAMB04168 TaxID=3138567 RepID=UPI0031F638AC